MPGTVLQWCRLFKQCQNLPARYCVAGVQTVSAMSEPTCRALCCSGAGCLSSVGTYLPGTVIQWCRLFKGYQNLPTRHYVAVVQADKAMSEPTCRALCYSGAGCLSNFRTYLPGTVLQGCRRFQQCLNLPAGHCVAVVAGCLSSVGTNLRGTVIQWCRLFKGCQNLPAGHCATVVQAV